MKELIFIVFYYLYYWFNLQAQKNHLLLKVYGIEKEKKQRKGLCCCKSRKSKGHVVPEMSPSKPTFSDSPSTPSLIGESQKGKAKGIVVTKEDFDYAYELLNNRLDIVTIVKEINTLKFLTHFLLSEAQVTLIPYVSLSHDLYLKSQSVKPVKQAKKRCGNEDDDEFIRLKHLPPSIEEAKTAIKEVVANLAISSERQFNVLTVGGGSGGEISTGGPSGGSRNILSRLHREMNKYSLHNIKKTYIGNTLLDDQDKTLNQKLSGTSLIQKEISPPHDSWIIRQSAVLNTEQKGKETA